MFFCQSPNVRKNGENSKMLILIVDCCDRYSGEGVFTEQWYLIVLWSLAPIVVVVGILVVYAPSLNLLVIFFFIPF